ncbi:hypothetical protein DYB30_004219 [Aphanomyces astaci]|uniref:BTB domain-containing protein n=1 Tax=Aphanomyces astaci TaxID=112090 RepID=A0A397C7A5_APHAT|nr:hypothetical protein DYB30_004219 [Aphanomyces astaci]
MTTSIESAGQVATAIRSALAHVDVETKSLEAKMAEWAELEARVQANINNHPNIVSLNVGGTTFETAKQTLLRGQDTYFHALLGSGQWTPDGDAAYFLDLDPHLFRRVLTFLRTGKEVSMEGLTNDERDELASMLEYLKLEKRPQPLPVPIVKPVEWDCQTHSPGMELTNHGKSIQGCASVSKWQCAAATNPLTGTFRVRVDSTRGEFRIALSPPGIDVSCTTSTIKCYMYASNGVVFNRNNQVAIVSALKAGDVVTMQRGPSRVNFSLNDGNIIAVMFVDSPSGMLFPVVFMRGQSKFTILD